jgi:hypothetical protein
MLLATSFVRSMDDLVDRYTVLGNIPGIDFATIQFEKLRSFYFHNEPTVSTSGLGVFTKAFGEYRPYWNFIALLSAVLLIDIAMTYGDTYPPYLDITDAISVLTFQIVTVTLITMMLLVPVTAISFRYSLSGRIWRLRLMSVISLMLVGTAIWFGPQLERDDPNPSMFSMLKIDLRMSKADFRDKLTETAVMFFLYHHFNQSTESESLTADLRNQLQGIAPDSEAKAIGVKLITHRKLGDPWLVMTYNDTDYGERALLAVGPHRDPLNPNDPEIGLVWLTSVNQIDAITLDIADQFEGAGLRTLDPDAPCHGMMEEFQACLDKGDVIYDDEGNVILPDQDG